VELIEEMDEEGGANAEMVVMNAKSNMSSMQHLLPPEERKRLDMVVENVLGVTSLSRDTR
jgi:vacuolar-type H+-ATPase subunit H